MRQNRFALATPGSRPGRARIGAYDRPAMAMSMGGIPMLLFLALPVATLLWRGLMVETRIPDLPGAHVWPALALSLQTSGIASCLTICLGTPLAYALAKGHLPLWWERSMTILIEIPLVLPPVVAGVALLLVFGRAGWLGQILYETGISIAFTRLAVVLAQLFVASPFYIRSAVLGLAQIDPEIENASALDGASFWQTLGHITFPLTRYALLTGSITSWARALGEFGATLIFAGNVPGRTQTMPMVIYLGFEIDMTVSLVLASILLAVALVVLTLTRLAEYRWLHPRPG